MKENKLRQWVNSHFLIKVSHDNGRTFRLMGYTRLCLEIGESFVEHIVLKAQRSTAVHPTYKSRRNGATIVFYNR